MCRQPKQAARTCRLCVKAKSRRPRIRATRKKHAIASSLYFSSALLEKGSTMQTTHWVYTYSCIVHRQATNDLIRTAESPEFVILRVQKSKNGCPPEYVYERVFESVPPILALLCCSAACALLLHFALARNPKNAAYDTAAIYYPWHDLHRHLIS